MPGQLISHLIDAFNRQGTLYCHWKSNFSLANTLSGETDLDLLIDRRSMAQATSILLALGFKPAMVITGPVSPGIYHYYGFDPQLGQLIHAHLFTQILTGESFVKSHLLPFEEMLLENCTQIGQMRAPSKPAELVLFILRTMIKYGSLLDLLYIYRDAETIRAELSWLRSDADLSQALGLLKKYCPVIDRKLFLECMSALEKTGNPFEKLLLAQRIRWRLRIYTKDKSLDHALLYVQLLINEAVRRLKGNKKNRKLCSGGAVIAFIGPEATGKSTLVSASQHWLGNTLAVHSVHVGKPPTSWITAPLNFILPLSRKLLPNLRTSRLEGHVTPDKLNASSKKRSGLAGFLYALRSVSIAWDRHQILMRAHRLATNGQIVICDRYPSEEIGAMDSPRLTKNRAGHGLIASLYNHMACLESNLYHEIPPPDIVLRLSVSIETAKQRNRDRIKPGKETDAYLESRHRQSRTWTRVGTNHIFDVSTEGRFEDTFLTVQQVIWESL